MTEKKHTPSPWEHPELYEKFREENPLQEKGEQTLKEYILIKLSTNGFYIEEEGENIKAWARSTGPGSGHIIVGPSGEQYVILSSVGVFNQKKNLEILKNSLAKWSALYKAQSQSS
jgi:hypothetical protein